MTSKHPAKTLLATLLAAEEESAIAVTDASLLLIVEDRHCLHRSVTPGPLLPPIQADSCSTLQVLIQVLFCC